MRAIPELVILGAGGFGREVLAAAIENPSVGKEWNIGGFLDDSVDSARKFLSENSIGLPVLGEISGHDPVEAFVYICAIGDPITKLAICQALLIKGATFINLIHPTAQIGSRSKIGIGNILMYQAGLTVDVKIGNFVTINRFSSIGHDASIGDGCTLSSYCDVTGHAKLGKGVFMGSHAVLLPNASAGDFSKIGAGSIVLKHVNAKKTVLGVPAKVLELPGSSNKGD